MGKGFITIPTDATFVEGTKKYIEMWGADAVRDCDGVSLPANVNDFGCEVYKAYFIVREDHEYAKAHPEYLESIALITKRKTAFSPSLDIDLMEGIFQESISVNEGSAKKYWQVYDRTTGELHPDWEYIGGNIVRVKNAKRCHEYTVSFFGRSLWDPVQIYNYFSNDWDVEKDRDMDPIYPEALQHMLDRMEQWCIAHPEVSVVRFTTFFYNFFIVYKTGKQQAIWDWHTYAMSASPAMFEAYREEYGEEITLEDIVTGGTYATRYSIPSEKTRKYIDMVQRKCCAWAKLFVDIVHKHGKKAMMFDGDHRIGTEPYNPYFASIGLDAVVGAPHSGPYIRLLSDMEGIRYTEGRLNPYFFPNECPSDEEGVRLLSNNWNSEKRGMLKKPIDRIGFGGYLKQVDAYPNFVQLIKNVCDEFRTIKENAGKEGAASHIRVGVLSYWGRQASWMMNGNFTDDTKPLTDGLGSLFDAICGQPVDTKFLSFDEAIEGDLSQYDVIVTTGLVGSSFQGGPYWKNPRLLEKIRDYVSNGGGFFGMGDPSGCEWHGQFFQLSDVLGVQKETGFTFATIKSFSQCAEGHWILEGVDASKISFSSQGSGTYPTEATALLCSGSVFNPVTCQHVGGTVNLAVHSYGKGRAVYLSGTYPSFDAVRLIYRSLLWAAQKEDCLERGFSTDVRTDCYYYPDKGSYAVLNNSDDPVETTFFDNDKKPTNLKLAPHEIRWIEGR